MEWIPAHVGNDSNEMADGAMTTGTYNHTKPSKLDVYPLINEAVTEIWQSQWTNSNISSNQRLNFNKTYI